MVLRLSGVRFRTTCGQCRTGGRLFLDFYLVFVDSFLCGGRGIIRAGVLEQPVQNLMSLCQSTV